MNSKDTKICNPWNSRNKLMNTKDVNTILQKYGIKKYFKDFPVTIMIQKSGLF